MGYKTFWHITPAYNQDSIAEQGIRPDKAHADRKLCWFVKWQGIAWVLAHVSARHGIPVNQLVAIRIRVKDGDFKHHRLSMYYSEKVQSRGMYFLAGDKALKRWERQRSYYGRQARSEARAK